MKKINTKKLETLTTENMHKAATIIRKDHPDMGDTRFNQDFSVDRFHTHGVGANSATLFEGSFHFWAIASYK